MSSAIATLTKAFWGICTFRMAPQDIPASSVLLLLTTLLNLLLSVLINQLKLPLAPSVEVAMIEMVVLFGLTAALLYSSSRTVRLVQTMTALMGTGAVVSVVVLVGMLAVPKPPLAARIGILLWNLLIMAHILRHALDTRFVVGFLVAVGYAFSLNQLILFVGHLLATAHV